MTPGDKIREMSKAIATCPACGPIKMATVNSAGDMWCEQCGELIGERWRINYPPEGNPDSSPKEKPVNPSVLRIVTDALVTCRNLLFNTVYELEVAHNEGNEMYYAKRTVAGFDALLRSLPHDVELTNEIKEIEP